MTNSIWEIIAETPWWVCLIVFFLVKMALLSTKPRTIPVKNLFFMPIVFIPLSFVSIYFNLQLDASTILLWLSAMPLGVFLGWLQFRIFKIKAIKNESQLYLPGSWTLFIVIFVIFAAKFYYGYQLPMDPNAFKEPKYAHFFLFFYGLFTGVFIGRLVYSLRCVKVGPFMPAP